MNKSQLVDVYTCAICGTRTTVYTSSPDKYVRRELCECCGLPTRTWKSEAWKDKLYKAFLRKRRY